MISSGSRVLVNASDSRSRAFCGLRLSAISSPPALQPRTSGTCGRSRRGSIARRRRPGHRLFQRLGLARRGEPGREPAETIPRAPAATNARTAVPSAPA